MFTLFQVMTLDSWAAIARPMQAKAPGTVTIFFVAVILCVVMVLMNLITAVIVENAFSIAKADAEEQAKIREREKQNDVAMDVSSLNRPAVHHRARARAAGEGMMLLFLPLHSAWLVP
ncbi:hypothetical protein FOZ63_021762 [Perkinsus olseni]|uniref:Ion transport domain-containing protein n=1 Tax=Perkinsus olseni TaxID=32597 RepID=A0A7J6UFM1_PEROL|nr:hypothetical protein FOZ62_019789 [Perkinsus olseni]KAF4756052.1 hypothetical protein FOZ63_021762 [Perkinsus olseni]